MEDSERLARAGRLRDEAMRMVEEMNRENALAVARANCEQCPLAKATRDDVVVLANGVSCSLYTRHCEQQPPECTAEVALYFMVEPHEVSDRLVQTLVKLPELQAIGLGSKICLMPGARMFLTCRVPVLAPVLSVIATVEIEEFRRRTPTTQTPQVDAEA